MPPLDDHSANRWRWLDWWFAPRWRALLTWVGCAMIAAVVAAKIDDDRLMSASEWFVDMMTRIVTLPRGISYARRLVDINMTVLMFWYEPLVLRLNLPRGMLWMAARCLPIVALYFTPPGAAVVVLCVLPGVAAVPGLCGWRTRPWMTVIGGILSLAFYQFLNRWQIHQSTYSLIALTFLPSAAVLLYGTRLLTPEERERGLVVREPAE